MEAHAPDGESGAGRGARPRTLPRSRTSWCPELPPGSPAVLGRAPSDRLLCVPSFHWVCHFSGVVPAKSKMPRIRQCPLKLAVENQTTRQRRERTTVANGTPRSATLSDSNVRVRGTRCRRALRLVRGRCLADIGHALRIDPETSVARLVASARRTQATRTTAAVVSADGVKDTDIAERHRAGLLTFL